MFRPTDLTGVISDTFEDSIATLEKLPRLILAPEVLRLFGREVTVPGKDGQSILDMLMSSDYLETLKEDIIQAIKDSYREAEDKTEEFQEYYSLFKLGKEWDPRNYLVTEDGSKYLGPLSVDEIDPSLPFDNFLVHPEQEPEINLRRLQEDTAQLKSEEKRVNALSMGTVGGALYVDTRNL